MFEQRAHVWFRRSSRRRACPRSPPAVLDASGPGGPLESGSGSGDACLWSGAVVFSSQLLSEFIRALQDRSILQHCGPFSHPLSISPPVPVRGTERELVVPQKQDRLLGEEGIVENREGQTEPSAFEFTVDQADLRISERIVVGFETGMRDRQIPGAGTSPPPTGRVCPRRCVPPSPAEPRSR